MICTFFGHGDCYDVDVQKLQCAIEDLILNGVDTFYVGNQGQFDSAVYTCLKQLRSRHPHIRVCVILAYLPTEKHEDDDLTDTMYPEIEGHPKFALDRRNRWMIDRADVCICYIDHTWGGAYKFVMLAQKRGLTVINIGSAEI